MSCETAPVGCIWLHFGASAIKGAQRVKPLAAIYHAGYVLHHLSRAELSSSSFFEHWLASCGSPVCWLPALVLMSHTCAWLFNHSFSGFFFFNVAVKALCLYQEYPETPCCVKALAAALHHVAQIPPEVSLQSSRSSTDVTPQTWSVHDSERALQAWLLSCFNHYFKSCLGCLTLTSPV